MSVPVAPTDVIASAGNTVVYLQWTAPVSNGDSLILKYTVTATDPDDATTSQDVYGFTGFPPRAYAVFYGLTNGLEYTFTVTATNADGESAASGNSNVSVPRLRPGQLANVVDAFAGEVWQDFAINNIREVPEIQLSNVYVAENSDGLRVVFVPKSEVWRGPTHDGDNLTQPDELAHRIVRCDMYVWGWQPDSSDKQRDVNDQVAMAEQTMTRLFASMRNIATACVWDGVVQWVDDANLNRGGAVKLSMGFRIPAVDYTPVVATITSVTTLPDFVPPN